MHTSSKPYALDKSKRYEIIRTVGRGAFGEVRWLVRFCTRYSFFGRLGVVTGLHWLMLDGFGFHWLVCARIWLVGSVSW